MITNKVNDVSMISNTSQEEREKLSISFIMKDKLSNLSEKFFELNDYENPSINQIIKGLRLYLIEYMLDIDEEKPLDQLD